MVYYFHQTNRLWGEPWLTRRPNRLTNPFSTPEARVGGFWAIIMHGMHTTITTRVRHSTSTLPVYNTLSIHTNRDLVVHERLASLVMIVQFSRHFSSQSRGARLISRSGDPARLLRPWNANQCVISTDIIKHDTYRCLILACIRHVVSFNTVSAIT